MSPNKAKTFTSPNGKKITVIPATKSLHPEYDGVEPVHRKKRVAAYCRVSTVLEEQQGSYDLQQSYYEAMIKNNPKWEFAGIYGDEGKSGTSLKGRTGFLEMMDDVRAGKIDCIITKATSRFGRNNAEFIQTLDELNSFGVEVLFESEGILTSGTNDRMMLQMMGIANEHYSSTLSNNVRWSKERNMRKGKITISYKTFLGYRKGQDGNPEIVEEEAKIIRLIYDLFLEGKTYAYIAKYLNEKQIPTPGGKEEWRGSNIKSILTNEKYTGDVLLQKTYKRSYLDKRSQKNTGEKPRVLIEDNHPAIIDKATFARVQELILKKKDRRSSGTDKNPFVGRIICAECKAYYGHKVWHSRGHIKYDMWVCSEKYTEENAYGGDKCKAANVRQEWIEKGYVYTLNQLLARKPQTLAKYGRKLKQIDARLASKEIDNEIKSLIAEYRKTEEQKAVLKGEFEFTFGDHSGYRAKKDSLKNKTAEIDRRIKELEGERRQLNISKKLIQTFISTLEAMPEQRRQFYGKDFINTIDRVEVGKYVLAYHFYGGECIKINIEAVKKMF